MNEIAWQSHQLTTPALDIAWHDQGNGPPGAVCMAGRVTITSSCALAAPLTQQFRCVLADQRGTGKSHLRPIDAHSLHIDRFLEDIDALRRHLGVDHVTLVGVVVGRSTRHDVQPGVSRAGRSVGDGLAGPIPYEMVAVYLADLVAVTAEERQTVVMLLEESRAAFQTGEWLPITIATGGGWR